MRYYLDMLTDGHDALHRWGNRKSACCALLVFYRLLGQKLFNFILRMEKFEWGLDEAVEEERGVDQEAKADNL